MLAREQPGKPPPPTDPQDPGKPPPQGPVFSQETFKRGDRSEDSRKLQQMLTQLGFNPGAVDGVFGAGTENALKEFQQKQGLKADGVVGPQTAAALAKAVGGAGPTNPPPPNGGNPQNGVAQIQSTQNAGAKNQMVTGQITVNGNTYQCRSGGHGRGSLPTGEYTVTPHLNSRSDASMSVGGVGWSFAVSDKFDPRVGDTRSLLRIHPDGGSAGTEG